MDDLPRGTVTFLFTDIEGSTRLWERDRVAMSSAIARHLELLRSAVAEHGGVAFKTVGDAIQAAFRTAPNAVAAAVTAQRALIAETWPDLPGPLRVRMALHTGAAYPESGDYLAAPLNRLARLLGAGHGGQILLTQVVQQLILDDLPADVTLRGLGAHRLRDLQEPEVVFQLGGRGLLDTFPPLRLVASHPTNLTMPPNALIGRDAEVSAILRLFGEGARLVTLTGPGGTGKTRLALEVAAEALDRYPDGVFFVDLSPVRDPVYVVLTIAGVLGIREFPGEALSETLGRSLADQQLLLVLDNLEQVLESGANIAQLLARCPHLAILATSRERLNVRVERVFPVLPLPLPDTEQVVDLSALAQAPAIALFVERAQSTDPRFVLTEENAPAVEAICRRLDGLPLAIELAAARSALLPPAALLARLERRLPLLNQGPQDAPQRQRTLSGTIEWSYDLLTPENQKLFRGLGVFASGWSLEAAEAVVGSSGDINVLGGLARLVEESLVRRIEGRTELPYFGMLETIHEFALEQLEESGEAEGIRDRHAEFFSI